jgi:mannose-6-phosphate isomerase
MEINIPEGADKETVFDAVESYIINAELEIAEVEDTKPWGGEFYIADESADRFIELYFPEISREDIFSHGTVISPKFMIFEPGGMLSWQYHRRRAELWKIVQGPVNVLESETDQQPDAPRTLQTGDFIQHDTLIRHRLICLDTWAVVAEIWQHTDPDKPTDKNDIVRLEDSYGRI